MSLADLDSPQPTRFTRPCTFKQWLDSLEPADATAVRTALHRAKSDPLYWSTAAIHERLRAAGWTGSDSVTYAHRNPTGCLSCR